MAKKLKDRRTDGLPKWFLALHFAAKKPLNITSQKFTVLVLLAGNPSCFLLLAGYSSSLFLAVYF